MKKLNFTVTVNMTILFGLTIFCVFLFSVNQTRAETWPHQPTEPVAKEKVPLGALPDS